MWSRAAWKEEKKEEELVILTNWIKGTTVYWPKGVSVSKAFADRKDPGDKWLRFPLVKVKITSGKEIIHKINFHRLKAENQTFKIKN